MSTLSYPFDAGELLQKKRAIKKELLGKGKLIEKRVAIMSGSTVGEVKNMLELFLLSHGIQPVFFEGGYSLFYEDLVFDNPALAAFEPELIYIHTSVRNINAWPSTADSAEQVDAKLTREFGRFKGAFTAAAKYNCPVIQNNFELPPYRIMGNRDFYDQRGRVNFVNRLNTLLAEYAAGTTGLYINDINYLAATEGLDVWHAREDWYAYKYAMAVKCIPALAHSVALIAKSILGKNHKSLILDLDNTLWGGIIGDDGADGISLGMETPTGMAYSEFQNYLKELSGLGVMLNVCSKNEKSIAQTGFEREDSPLKLDDFIAFKANWEPKHINIANIASELNIGQDAFVFIDDNPAEREIVRQNLPAVTVPEVAAPEHYIDVVARGGYFEVTTFSADDKKRNEMYKQNMQRIELEESFTDYTDYLLSLEMTGDFGPFNAGNMERVTQLINKTNQFNLTTRRYTPAQVQALTASDEYITLYGRLVDKFGDNGLTACIIGHVTGESCHIDLWVMSCRVFKRDLELAMFDSFVAACLAKGVTKITGSYYPTAKNLLAKDFYATIGFTMQSEDDDGNREFTLENLAGYENKNKVIKLQ
ncbi:HAD-IIIC family phosphatase [Ruminococcaceae bacterium OttesenSCG-928-N02]|nr:HAD-IIIC family phosphatase [Ruminococcaceae bacterium OttesenSCG-928-N02]